MSAGTGARGIGDVSAMGYAGPIGVPGGQGGPGQGGGGGGGAYQCDTMGMLGGASGGGGGAGGCGGAEGNPAQSGGSSFGVLELGVTPVLMTVAITTHDGGAGGTGGDGQPGGAGGTAGIARCSPRGGPSLAPILAHPWFGSPAPPRRPETPGLWRAPPRPPSCPGLPSRRDRQPAAGCDRLEVGQSDAEPHHPLRVRGRLRLHGREHFLGADERIVGARAKGANNEGDAEGALRDCLPDDRADVLKPPSRPSLREQARVEPGRCGRTRPRAVVDGRPQPPHPGARRARRVDRHMVCSLSHQRAGRFPWASR
jgi:hypothetical protein